jgi:hypothetical protein
MDHRNASVLPAILAFLLLLFLLLMVRSNFIVLLRIGNHYILRLPYLTKLDQEEIAQK